MANTYGQIGQNGTVVEMEPSPTVVDSLGNPVYRPVVSVGDGGSGGGVPVAPANPPPAPANLATGQAAMSSAAAVILAARTGGPGVGRVSGAIYNSGSSTLYIGPTSGVLTTTGFPVLPGGTAQTDTQSAVYGICAATLTTTANFAETW